MQQLPPAICTAPVNEPDTGVEVSNGIIAVGVSEAVGVNPSAGGMDVLVSVDGTRVERCVGLATCPCPRAGMQETAISTKMENKISFFIIAFT